jgi:hypothetical protein
MSDHTRRKKGAWQNRSRADRPAAAQRPDVEAQSGRPTARSLGFALREIAPGEFEFAHPTCVEEMRPDYQEAMELARAGEIEDARDVLRHALAGCRNDAWIHVALGQIALSEAQDPTLARGHFGYVVELAERAVPRDFTGGISPERPANRIVFEAIDGLIATLNALGRRKDADVVHRIAQRWIGPTTTPRQGR